MESRPQSPLFFFFLLVLAWLIYNVFFSAEFVLPQNASRFDRSLGADPYSCSRTFVISRLYDLSVRSKTIGGGQLIICVCVCEVTFLCYSFHGDTGIATCSSCCKLTCTMHKGFTKKQ